jgi:hypothetical protein
MADLEHLQRWIRYIGDHGIVAYDRLAYANMGFVTSMYARVLRDNDVPVSLLRDFERRIYPLVPGLSDLRIKHGHRNTSTAEGLPYPWSRQAERIRQSITDRSKSVIGKATSSGANLTAQHGAQTRSQGGGKGIVVLGGDGNMRYTIQMLAAIRQGHHCDIPIEVYYCGNDDLSEQSRKYIARKFENVRVIDMLDLDIFDESIAGLQRSGAAMKPYALMASNFSEVILADGDTVFLADPHDFFNEKGYQTTGTLFFNDRLVHAWKKESVSEFFYEQLGGREPSEQLANSDFMTKQLANKQASGVVVLNKRNPDVFASLLFTLWQNSAQVRDDLAYEVLSGEKETYWSSFEMADLPYHFSPFYAGAIGPEHAVHIDGFCSDHQLHLLNAPATAHGKHKAASKLRSGRAAWLSGSMLKNKNHGIHDDFMEVHSSVWATDGVWDWFQDELGRSSFCLQRYTRRSVAQLDMYSALPGIIEAGKEITRDVVQVIDEEE